MSRIRIKALAAAAAALLVSALALCACSSSSDTTTISESDTTSGNYLTVGVRENMPKFSVYNEEADTFYGFEADLARQVALELGYDGVRYVGVVADEREDALDSGKVDCIIATFSRTDSRAEKYALSDPYYTDKGRVMVEKSTMFESYKDLQGCTVAVHSGTDVKEVFAKKLAELGLIQDSSDAALDKFLTIREFDQYDDMHQALEVGQVDALCSDGIISLPWLNDESMYLDEPYSDENYVIATVKDSSLAEDLNKAVGTLKDNGTIDKLTSKWDI